MKKYCFKTYTIGLKTKWREKHPPARGIQRWSSNKKSKQDILSFFIDPSDLIQRNVYPQIIGRTVQFSKAVIWDKFKYKQLFPHLLSTLTEQVFIFPATNRCRFSFGLKGGLAPTVCYFRLLGEFSTMKRCL